MNYVISIIFVGVVKREKKNGIVCMFVKSEHVYGNGGRSNSST